jgi:dual specificity phosphatase 12
LISARSARSLGEHSITHILSVCADSVPAEAPESDIHHKRINIEDIDYADLLIHLPSAVEFIQASLDADGVVLVHCDTGISRSAAVVAAYRRLSFQMFC